MIYVNTLDMELGVEPDILSKFADDTKIGNIVNSEESRNVLQSVLDCAANWSDKWQMMFNPSKCTVIHFGHNNQHHQYKLGGQVLKNETSEKDLGIYVSSDLKPSIQCQKAQPVRPTGTWPNGQIIVI